MCHTVISVGEHPYFKVLHQSLLHLNNNKKYLFTGSSYGINVFVLSMDVVKMAKNEVRRQKSRKTCRTKPSEILMSIALFAFEKISTTQK